MMAYVFIELSVRMQDQRPGFFTNEKLETVVSPEAVEEVNELDETKSINANLDLL